LMLFLPILVSCSSAEKRRDDLSCRQQTNQMFGSLNSIQSTQYYNNCVWTQDARRNEVEKQKLIQKQAKEQQTKELQPYIDAASTGNAEAQYQVGLLYTRYSDTQNATTYFKLAALQGYGPAEFQLGQSAERTNKGLDESLYWYDLAFTHGMDAAGNRADQLREQQRIALAQREAAAKKAEQEAKEAAKYAEAAKRIDEIIIKDSAGWSYDKYDPGSLHNVEILSQSGSDIILKGFFRYIKAYNHNSNPWVIVKFHDFKVSCVTYWNFPDTCRSLNEKSRN